MKLVRIETDKLYAETLTCLEEAAIIVKYFFMQNKIFFERNTPVDFPLPQKKS
jgi:hypothetical protein